MTNSTPPFSQRLALLLVAAILCALVMGVVTFFAFGNAWVAVLTGLTALGGSFAFLHAHVR